MKDFRLQGENWRVVKVHCSSITSWDDASSRPIGVWPFGYTDRPLPLNRTLIGCPDFPNFTSSSQEKRSIKDAKGVGPQPKFNDKPSV